MCASEYNKLLQGLYGFYYFYAYALFYVFTFFILFLFLFSFDATVTFSQLIAKLHTFTAKYNLKITAIINIYFIDCERKLLVMWLGTTNNLIIFSKAIRLKTFVNANLLIIRIVDNLFN